MVSVFAVAPRNLQQPLQRQRPLQTIRDQEPTLGHRKKLPAGKSEPTPAPVGPSSAPNILTAEEGPGRRGSRPGPSVLPGDSRGRWGNAAHDYTRSGIPFQPSKRGAEGRWLCAPTPPPAHPPGSAIATMKLRLGKGGEPTFCFSLACGYGCVLLSGGSNGQC
jgi:hypothetical protein